MTQYPHPGVPQPQPASNSWYQDQPPQRRSSKKLLLGCIGIFGLLLVMCAGTAGVAVYFFVKNDIAERNRHHQAYGNSTLASAEYIPVDPSGEPFKNLSANERTEITQAVSAFADGIANSRTTDQLYDFPRTLIEIDAIATAGNDMGINKLAIARQLGQYFEMPPLDQNAVIVGCRMLKENEEACVTVANTSYDAESLRTYALYMSKRTGRWKVYDFRDTLSSMSEAEFYGNFLNYDGPLDQSYSDMTYDMQAISEMENVSDEKKASKVYQRYLDGEYPPVFLSLAQEFTISYLNYFNDKKYWEMVVRAMDLETSNAAVFYRALFSHRNGDETTAFELCKQLNTRLGWHPAATSLMLKVARKPEQRAEACKWMAASMLYSIHTPTDIRHFFAIVDAPMLSELIHRCRAADKLDVILDNSEYIALRGPAFVDELQSSADLSGISATYFDHLRLLAAYDDQNWDEVLRLAPAILAEPSLAELHDQVATPMVNAAAKTNALSSVITDDISSPLLDALLNFDFDQPGYCDHAQNFEMLYGLQNSAKQHKLYPELLWALSQFDVTEEQQQEILGQLEQFVAQEQIDLTDSELPNAYLWIQTLATLVNKLGRYEVGKQYFGDDEAAFVVLASYAESAELRTLLNHFEKTGTVPYVWLEYYTAQDLIEQNDWEGSDAAMSRAIQAARQDARFAKGDFSELLFNYLPFDDIPTIETLMWERLYTATRTGNVAQTLQSMLDEGEVTREFIKGYVSENAKQMAEFPELFERMQAEGAVDENAAFIAEMAGYAAEKQGDFRLTFIQQMAVLENSNADDVYLYRGRALRALDLALLSNDQELLNEFAEKHVTSTDKLLEAVVLLVRGDSEAFFNKLDTPQATYQPYELSTLTFRTLARRVGVLAQLDAHPLMRGARSSRYDLQHGLIFADGDYATATQQTIAGLEQLLQVNFQQPAENRFVGTQDAWYADHASGRFIVLGTTREVLQANRQRCEWKELDQRFENLIQVTWIPLEVQSQPEVNFRRQLSQLGKRITVPTTYYDYASFCEFIGDQWSDDLAANLATGVNPLRPRQPELYTELFDYSSMDKRVSRMSVGWFAELIPAEPIMDEETFTSKWKLTAESLVNDQWKVGDLVDRY